MVLTTKPRAKFSETARRIRNRAPTGLWLNLIPGVSITAKTLLKLQINLGRARVGHKRSQRAPKLSLGARALRRSLRALTLTYQVWNLDLESAD